MHSKSVEYRSLEIISISLGVLLFYAGIYRYVHFDFVIGSLDIGLALSSLAFWKYGLKGKRVNRLVMPWLIVLMIFSIFVWFRNGGVATSGTILLGSVLLAIVIVPAKWRNIVSLIFLGILFILVLSEDFLRQYPIWGTNPKMKYDFLLISALLAYIIWYLKVNCSKEINRVDNFGAGIRELHRLNLNVNADLDDLLNDYLRSGIGMLKLECGLIAEMNDGIFKSRNVIAAGINSGNSKEGYSPDYSLMEAVASGKETIHITSGDTNINIEGLKGNTPKVYLGTPLMRNQEVYGVLNFFSQTINRKGFENHEIEIIELMALNISHLLNLKFWKESGHEAESELGLSEKRFKSIYDYANIGICVSAMDGKITMVNQFLEKLYGYSEEELLDSNFYSYSHPDDMAEDLRLYEELIIGKIDKYYLEKRNITRGGEVIDIALTVSTIADEDGQIRYTVSIVDDITKRKHSEDKINELNWELADQVEKMEVANKELEAFSYSVSHDLRAPLRAIGGFSRIMIEDYGDRFDHEAIRLMNVITTNSRKMGVLIDDLLHFSQITRKAIAFKAVDTTALIHELIEELAIDPKILKLNPLPVIKAERTLIKQVFSNLIGNALKFSAHNPSPVVEIGVVEKNGKFEFFVSDNGVGFNMAYYNKLFGVFQRLHSDAEFEGTGVGLAIVQKVIAKHKGTVWAESEEGKGATFYFSMPNLDSTATHS